jgi:hypothetical protein
LSATTEIGFSGPFFTFRRSRKIGSCEIDERGLAAAAILSRAARGSRLPDLLLRSSGRLINGLGVRSLAAHQGLVQELGGRGPPQPRLSQRADDELKEQILASEQHYNAAARRSTGNSPAPISTSFWHAREPGVSTDLA